MSLMSEQSIDLAPLLAEVRQAGSVVAPYWPVSSFVAVNPLGGLEHLPFREATATARSLFALGSCGRRDPELLEMLRIIFAKEQIPLGFLSHYESD